MLVGNYHLLLLILTNIPSTVAQNGTTDDEFLYSQQQRQLRSGEQFDISVRKGNSLGAAVNDVYPTVMTSISKAMRPNIPEDFSSIQQFVDFKIPDVVLDDISQTGLIWNVRYDEVSAVETRSEEMLFDDYILNEEYRSHQIPIHAKNLDLQEVESAQTSSKTQFLDTKMNKTPLEVIVGQNTAESPRTASVAPPTFLKPEIETPHYHLETSNPVFAFVCGFGECNKRFRKLQKYLQHLRSHNKKAKSRCNWRNCGLCFNEPMVLARHYFQHVATDYPDIEILKCPDCDEKFWAKLPLRIHHTKVHKDALGKNFLLL